MERILACEPSPYPPGTHRRWRGHERRAAEPLDINGDETEEEYDDSSKPRKVHCRNWWKGFSGCSLAGHFEIKKHKRKEHNSGRHGLTPLSFTIQCQVLPLKKW